MTTIIKGNIIHAPELGRLDILPGGHLVLEDGVIQAISQALPKEYAGLPVTDYGDKLILQSFADCHLHGSQYPFLGTGMDVTLLDWLQKYAFPVEKRFADVNYARMVYRQLAEELIANGTTRVIMFSSLHADGTLVLMEELERAGISGYVGKVNMDRNGSDELHETTEESISETLRWLDHCGQFRSVKPILTPRFTPSCTDELMAWLGKTSREQDLYVHSHLSENDREIAWVHQLHPGCERYWETYAKFGLWKDHTVMAHCVYSDETERKAMREHNVMAVHCPDSNVNVRSGIAPVRRMLEEGNWVSLGSDIAGGAHLSMLEVMTCAIRSSKLKSTEDGTQPLNAAEAYYLGTTAGHRYFGAGKGFAIGDRLHAVVVDDSRLCSVGEMSLSDRLERALYRVSRQEIKAVYAEGKLVKCS